MQLTYDGCPRVIEYSNTGCVAPAVTTPQAGVQIDAWYRGPFSRCLQEGAGFGRNGAAYQGTAATADCYRMSCLGGELYVVIDGYNLRCPQGQFINLDDYPGVFSWRCVLQWTVFSD
jgi:hypothetical protein